MSHTATAPTAPTTPTALASGLRGLHLIRVAVSLVWVALVAATSAQLTTVARPPLVTAVLLVAYPLWDGVATLLERRMAGAASRVNSANLVLAAAATAGMAIAVAATVGTAMLVFGGWALLAGVLQLAVAVRRWRTVGAQWPMAISGGQGAIAGVSIAVMGAGQSGTLQIVAGYSAFGAFWFVVSAVVLSIRSRRAA